MGLSSLFIYSKQVIETLILRLILLINSANDCRTVKKIYLGNSINSIYNTIYLNMHYRLVPDRAFSGLLLLTIQLGVLIFCA